MCTTNYTLLIQYFVYSLLGSVFLYNQLIENSEQLCMDKMDPWTYAQVNFVFVV